MVDNVNGMPNFSAARAAKISPSACAMPVKPVGAIATGIFTSCPIILVSKLRPSILTNTFWRKRMSLKSEVFSR